MHGTLVWTTHLEAFAALGSAIVAVLLLYYTLRFRRELDRPQQVSNIPNFLAVEYSRRSFDPPLQAEDRTISDVKEARVQAEEAKEDGTFFEESLGLGTWQNRYAYEISLGLQQVGLMVLSGALPARIVLADIADTAVRDWMDCRPLVEDRIRKDHQITSRTDDTISFQRRHGEWLALASALYLRERFKAEAPEDLAESYGGWTAVEEREAAIRSVDQGLVPPSTSERLDGLLSRREGGLPTPQPAVDRIGG